VTRTGRRVGLYGAMTVVAGALLFLGFGITFPPDANTRLNGATMLAESGDVDQALAICDLVLEEHPDNRDARVYRAAFLALAKRHDAAVAAYDDALAHVDGDAALEADLRLDRASVLLEAGRNEEFEQERQRFASKKDPRVHQLDGLAASKKGDWSRAVAAYRSAAALAPEDQTVKARLWNAEVAKGEADLANRRFEDALASFDDACALFPNAVKAHLKAAEVLLATERPGEALARLRQLGARTPGIAPLVFRGATGLLAKGDERGALEALEGANAADPQVTRTLFESDPAWRTRRNDPVVLALLESPEKNNESGLTGPE